MPKARGSSLALPGVLLTVVIWGSYYPVVERLLADWDPVTLSFARTLLAGATLIVLLVAVEGTRSLRVGAPWPRVVVLGMVGMAGNILILTFGILYSGAVPAALIAGMSPALAALMARVLYGQAIQRDQWVAIALAVAGVVVIVLGGASWQGGFRGGEFLVLAAYLLWLWYLFAAQRWLPGFSQLRISALTMGAGGISMAAVYAVLLLVGYGPVRALALFDSVALLVYSAVVSVAVGVVLWNHGVSHLGVTTTTIYGNLVPIVAVAMSVGLGAPVSWFQVLGGAMVLAGVVALQLRSRRAANRP